MRRANYWRQRSEWTWCSHAKAYTALFEDPDGCVTQYTDKELFAEQRQIARPIPPYPVSDEELIAAVRMLEAEGSLVALSMQTERSYYQSTHTDVCSAVIEFTPISTLLARAARELAQ